MQEVLFEVKIKYKLPDNCMVSTKVDIEKALRTKLINSVEDDIEDIIVVLVSTTEEVQ